MVGGVKKWMRRTLAVGCLAAVVWAVAAVKTFRFPAVDPPVVTDAYFFLVSTGGMAGVIRGFDHIPAGSAVVISVTDSVAAVPEYQQACARTDREIHCVTPDPLTTQGEARAFGRLAAERGWSSVTVISQLSHTTRARLLMQRCFPGTVVMNPIDTEHGLVWVRSLVYETGAMVKAWTEPGC